jgi:hypothetical protein
MLRRTAAVALAAVITVGVSRASAQSAQPWSLQASLLAASQKIAEGTEAVNGIGIEAQLRYTPAALWSLGGGVQYSVHPSGGDEIAITGFFIEPRYALDIGSDRFAPYLAGRFAILRQALELDERGDDDFASNGMAFGGGAGLLIRATRTINIDIGAALLRQSFSDAESGQFIVSFGSFMAYVAKAGISIGFGSR